MWFYHSGKKTQQGTQLTTDNNGGILSEEHHPMKCRVSDGVEVWWPPEEVSAPVLSDVLVTVHTQPPVGVH